MKPIRPNGYVLIALTLVTTFLLLGAFASWGDRPVKRNSDEKVMLIQSLKGADLFRSYCASCHGREGKGDGPVAPALNAKVPDLTTIAQRHGGVFPEKWVTELIEGPESVLAHGSREMPIWGAIFHQIENDRDYGQVRLKNVTDYLRSIQQK
jgi:mono/diheme cytochrome c family protein